MDILVIGTSEDERGFVAMTRLEESVIRGPIAHTETLAVAQLLSVLSANPLFFDVDGRGHTLEELLRFTDRSIDSVRGAEDART